MLIVRLVPSLGAMCGIFNEATVWRSFSATSRAPPGEVFGNRDVNIRFIKMLANHIAEREQQLIELAYHSVRRRVASTLINLYDQTQAPVHLLREDLASLAGTAKETLIRTLTDFKNEGLIETPRCHHVSVGCRLHLS